MSMRRREFLMRTGGVGAGLAMMRHGAAASFPDPDRKAWKDPAPVQSGAWTRRDVARAIRTLDAAGLVRGADRTSAVPGVAMRDAIHVVDGWPG